MLFIKAILLQVTHQKVYIFQFTKYENKGASDNIDSDDTNFSSVDLTE